MTSIRFSMFLAIAALLYTVGASAADNAPTSDSNGKPKHCLMLSAIQDMTIIDDKTLLIEMPGHQYYVNRLPRACHGIGHGNPILYRTSVNMLCSLDMITVLYPIGGGFHQGSSCGLGMFVPISKAEAKKMRSKKK